jgi:hypothetical protein
MPAVAFEKLGMLVGRKVFRNGPVRWGRGTVHACMRDIVGLCSGGWVSCGSYSSKVEAQGWGVRWKVIAVHEGIEATEKIKCIAIRVLAIC